MLSANQAFLDISRNIIANGKQASPRHYPVLELEGPQTIVLNPLDSIITLKDRKVNYKFMAAEVVWILSGDTEPWICEHLKAWEAFLDTDNAGNKVLMGAYGPRLKSVFNVNQFEYVVNTLRKDPFSRQAIMTISYPHVDFLSWKDFPCTVFLQFQLRNNILDMTVTMRSNDLVKGCTYDWFNFSVIQCILASILKVSPGVYYHTANNLHLYEADLPKINTILNSDIHFTNIEMFPKLDTVAYDNLNDVFYEASYGKDLLKTKNIPISNNYISKLLKFILEAH